MATRKESHSLLGQLVKGLEVTRIGRLYTRNYEELVYGWDYGGGYFVFFFLFVLFSEHPLQRRSSTTRGNNLACAY